MSNLTDFFPSGGGGGLTPKFEEFNASGTFAPTQALIDAGGYIEVFLVGGGGGSTASLNGGAGGEVKIKKMYLTSVASCAIVIGGGGLSGNGGASSFSGGAAGGTSFSSIGGRSDGKQQDQFGASFAASTNGTAGTSTTAGSGVNGYGVGGSASSYFQGKGGILNGAANSGQGAMQNQQAGSGYCLIKWYE